MPSTVVPNVGEPIYGPVPALNSSALGQCWNGTVEMLERLAHPASSGDRLLMRRNPRIDQDRDKVPCCIVSHYDVRPDNRAGTNNETAVHYLFLVAYHWGADRSAMNGEADALAAWEEAYVAFSKRPRPFNLSLNGACLRDCSVDAARAFNEQAFMRGWSVKFLMVDYFVRLPYREGL